MRLNRILGASVLSLAILAGCGGDDAAPVAGGGTGGGGTTTSGQLTNSPVDGVGYTAMPSGLTGTTMNGGMFEFRTGDMVTFNIAGLQITVPGGTRITPQTLAEELGANETEVANILANLTSLFQTLDSDGDPDNGIVAVLSGATFGNNAAALLSNINADPATFTNELTMAVDGNTTLREGDQEVQIVSGDLPVFRFYRNELQGNWRLVNTVENGGAPIPTDDDFQVLLSFDAPIGEFPNGLINSFVYGEYDISNSEDPFSFVGVGTTGFNETTDQFELSSLPMRRLIADGTNSSTETDGVLYTSKVTFEGTNLVLTMTEGQTEIVATFERFDNVKNSLVGSWFEVFAQGDDSITPVAMPDSTGRTVFGNDVASVFYYFLSNTRVMLVFTDLDPAVMSDEKNGVIVANYSLNSAGDELTFGNVLIDTVSLDPNSPAFVSGLKLTVGMSMKEDTNRVLTDTDVPVGTEPDTLELFRILSLSERMGAFKQPAPAQATEVR